jgi:hypothetical protein
LATAHAPHGPPCQPTADAVVIHGTNAVCAPTRAADAAMSGNGASLALHGALAAAACVGLAVRAPRVARVARGLVLAAAVALAAPGLAALLTRRADAPGRIDATATRAATLTHALEHFAATHDGCVTVSRNDCTACDPFLRYVSPDRGRCARAAARVVLARDALATARCTETADALRCGTAFAATAAP